MNRELRQTADGSHTLFVPDLQEHYHSINGALQESRHIFIGYGLQAIAAKEVSILEVGFGTGLNAWLSAAEAAKHDIKIKYTALEKYPLTHKEIEALNYPALADNQDMEALFAAVHQAPWEMFSQIHPHFSLCKMQQDALHFQSNSAFDIIYFDAFAPAVQPELWTEKIFSSMFQGLKPNGILVTYCAQGQVKRNMKAAGFSIERLPGPPGKREITRARKGYEI